jgi:hypothetical protein
MEAPTPDPNKLLQSWMEWERGEVTPGRVMANMKTGGMRQLLEELSGSAGAPSGRSGSAQLQAVPDLVAPAPAPGSAGAGGAPVPEGEPGPVGGQPSTWAPIV